MSRPTTTIRRRSVNKVNDKPSTSPPPPIIHESTPPPTLHPSLDPNLSTRLLFISLLLISALFIPHLVLNRITDLKTVISRTAEVVSPGSPTEAAVPSPIIANVPSPIESLKEAAQTTTIKPISRDVWEKLKDVISARAWSKSDGEGGRGGRGEGGEEEETLEQKREKLRWLRENVDVEDMLAMIHAANMAEEMEPGKEEIQGDLKVVKDKKD